MFKPMLAAAIEDRNKLKFPLLASYKLDGIRAIVRDRVLVSRSLIAIPNRHLQYVFGRPEYEGLDGELIVGGATDNETFRRTSSAVMSHEGKPQAKFHVFDCVSEPNEPFDARRLLAMHRIHASRTVGKSDFVVVPQFEVHSLDELYTLETKALHIGYEGLMLRSANSPYKFGRGTVKAQDLMKLKMFEDAEAYIVEIEEMLHNGNETKVNALGQKERSSKREGLSGKKTMGSLKVVGLNGTYKGVTFNIGSGFTEAQRKQIWTEPGWVGKVVKFKYFPTGSKDAPRFPVFVGVRDSRDL